MLQYAAAVEVVGVAFTYNTVSTSLATAGLISLQNFLSLVIADCRFERNAAMGNLLVINSAMEVPMTANSDLVAVNFLHTHAAFRNLTFSFNIASITLIFIKMNADLLNIEVSACNFYDNTSGQEYMLEIEYFGDTLADRVNGTHQTVHNNNTGVTKSVYVPPSYIHFNDSVFANSTAYESLVKVVGCANLVIANVTLFDNGRTGSGYMQAAIKRFVDSPITGATIVPNLGPDIPCESLLHIEQVVNLALQRITSVNNTCLNSGTAVYLLQLPGINTITTFQVIGNTAGKTSGTGLHFSDYTILRVVNMTARGNRNSGKGVIYVQSAGGTELTVADSRFEGNVAGSGAAIYTEGCGNFTLLSTTFSGNIAKTGAGGAISFVSALSNLALLHISGCGFYNNSAQSGAGISISSLVTAEAVKLTVTDCTFEANLAEVVGASLYIDSPVSLNANSIVTRCLFTKEISAGGSVALYHKLGKIGISDCSFRGNAGSVASCVLVQASAAAETSLIYVSFAENTQAPLIVKPNFRLPSVIITANCDFRSHGVAAIVMENGQWRDSDSVISGSTVTSVELTNSAVATCARTVFRQNASRGNAGAVYQGSLSVLICSGCWFVNNTSAAEGGAILAEQGAVVQATDCRFEGNWAVQAGAAIHIQSANGNPSTIRKSQFVGNLANVTAVISLQSAVLLLEDVTIESNRANRTSGISALLSIVNLTRCTLRHQSGDESSFLSLFTSSTAVVLNSVFTDGAGTGASGISAFSSTLTVSDTVFRQFSGAGVVVASSSCRLTFSRVSVSSVAASGDGSIISASESYLSVTDCHFSAYNPGAIYGVGLAQLRVTESVFAEGTGGMGSAIYCLDCDSMEVFHSRIETQQAKNGAVYLAASDESTGIQTVNISNTLWADNTAESAGGLYIFRLHSTVTACSFLNNSASVTDGGGIFLDCSPDYNCTISFSLFQGNTAARSGGGIYWQGALPLIQNLTFTNNSAVYGAKIASFPVSLKVEVRRTDGNPVQRTLSDEISAAPGQALGLVLEALLIDHYGEVVTVDNRSIAELTTSTPNATVSGVSKITAIQGRFKFADFLIYADPMSLFSLSVSTAAVDSDSAPIPFSMRDCVVGESTAPKSCIVCEPPTYSFDPALPCQQCLAHSVCAGGFVVLPEKGYWRSGMYSTRVLECPLPAACEGGGPLSNGSVSYQGFCERGYRSNLCQSCDIDYSRTSKNRCDRCPPREINIIRLVFVAVGIFIVNAVLLLTSLRSATQPQHLYSIYFKIMANYWQLVFLVAEFKLQWPSPVLDLFTAQQSVGGATEQIYSIDCLLAEKHTAEEVYYYKMIYIAVLPVGVMLIAVVYWSLAAAYRHKRIFLQRELLATIVIAFFVIHPTLVKSLFSLFSCLEINTGEYWLTADYAIPCWNSQHVFYVLVVGLPAVVVWVIGVPLICLGTLIKYRGRHSEIWILLQYGFLITGYRPSRFYWEFIILGRKLAIICCFVFINDSIPIQALSVQLICIFFFFVQYEIRPYTTPELNRMELAAILVADITIYCGLFYLTGDLHAVGSWLFFVLIVLTNAVFLVYWTLETMKTLIETVARALPSIGIKFFPSLLDHDEEMEEFIRDIQGHRDYAWFPLTEVKKLYRVLLAHSFAHLVVSPRSSPTLYDIPEEREQSSRQTNTLSEIRPQNVVCAEE